MTLVEREKTCAKCGAPFGCGGLLGCWCRDVTLDETTLANLRQSYADCLCPNCLKSLQAAHKAVTDASVTNS